MRSFIACSVVLVALACRASAEPQRTAAPLIAAGHGANHADPAAPFTLSVAATPHPDGSVTITVQVVPRLALPSLELGLDLPQEITRLEGDLRKLERSPAPDSTLTLTARVHRAIPGTAGITVRAWAEHRREGLVLGDERALVLFGPAPVGQSFLERRGVSSDGGALHETILP